jgi:hypothetical protein
MDLELTGKVAVVTGASTPVATGGSNPPLLTGRR